MPIPALVVSYEEYIPAEFFADFAEQARRSGVSVDLQSREGGPTMGIDWLLPATVTILLGKPFFDALLKRAADEAADSIYPKLKHLIVSLASKVLIGTRGMWRRVTPSGDLPREGRSAFFAIEAEAASSVKIKFVFDEGKTAQQYDLVVEKALRLLFQHFHPTDIDPFKDAPATWRTIYNIYDEEHQCWRPVDVMDEMRKERARSRRPTAFLSYNHADSGVADKLKAALEKHGVAVRIDNSTIRAGANIQKFIENSIHETLVTLSIISNRSLLSAWVALESIETFYHEKFTGSKKFIACYIDDDFFRPEFRLSATKQINAKLEEIDRLIPEYIAEKIDTNDLNTQKSRLHRLRNNLGDILLRLKESLCLDIREDKFDESVAKIVAAINDRSN